MSTIHRKAYFNVLFCGFFAILRRIIKKSTNFSKIFQKPLEVHVNL